MQHDVKVRQGTQADLSAEAILSLFLDHQRRRGYSPLTTRTYLQYLSPFVKYVGERGLHEVTPREVELGWLTAWSTGHEARYGRVPSPRTVRNNLIAPRALFRFVVRYGVGECNR